VGVARFDVGLVAEFDAAAAQQAQWQSEA